MRTEREIETGGRAREREITERLHSGIERRTHRGERDRGRIGESNLLEIKSDRTDRAGEKKGEIMGVFLLLPSLHSSVISHQGTLSPWIPSSLRQFHSLLSVSVTQSSPSPHCLNSAAGLKLTLFLLHWPCGPS